MVRYSFILLGLCISVTSAFGQKPTPSYQPQTLIIKINPEDNEDQGLPTTQPHVVLKRPEESIRPIVEKSSKYLNHVYIIHLSDDEDIDEVLHQLQGIKKVLYVEKISQEQLLYQPNDPLAQVNAGQYHLTTIKAYEAWEITQGSENIVIGISDTGIDFEHDDIKGNLYRNPDEIFNGLDDDGNGYVDDIHGYDFADFDSVAQVGESVHGNQVAGIAGASTNNGIGVAGVGFKSKISPLKMFTSTGTNSIGSYESILYAANEGYDVINLSWGSVNSFSQAAQDIINYAVLEKNVVLVAAAGNTHALLDYYPASYDHVLSVGWANSDDTKANNGTFSYNIDLVAPGTAVLSTFKNNGYYADVGSSFATPMVSGAAALVKSYYPQLNALQIMEVIRTTTDDIYSIPANAPYEGQLGSGRLNIHQALTKDTLRSVRANEIVFSNDFGNYAFYGDTIDASFTLQNFLYPLKNGQVTLTVESPYATLLTDPINFDFSDSLDSKDFALPLLTLAPNTPPRTAIPIRLDYTSGTYSDFQYKVLTTSPDYVEIGNTQTQLLVGGNGDLAYSALDPLNIGYKRKGITLIRSLGLLIGTSKDSLADNVINNLNTSEKDEDFTTSIPIKYGHYELASSFAESVFKDNKLNLNIEQTLYASEVDSLQNSTIIRYRITNTGSSSITGLQAGLYADWLLVNNTKNRALYNCEERFVYAFDKDSTYYAGIKIVSESEPITQSINLNSFNGNIVDLKGELNDSIKYALLKASKYDSAGLLGEGNDVSQLIATRTFELSPNQSKEVVFILSSADKYDELIYAFRSAENVFATIVETPPLLARYRSCEGAILEIVPQTGSVFNFYQDAFGQQLLATNDTLIAGPFANDTTLYVQQADSPFLGPVRRISINKITNVAHFESSLDTLYLDHPTINRVQFFDKSFDAISWSWDFENGTSATIQNPSVNFTNAGTYTISLKVINRLGCEDTFEKQLVVTTRPSQPMIVDQITCFGENVTISDVGSTLRVYLNPNDKNPIYEGSAFIVENVISTLTYSVTRLENGFESLRKSINISPDPINASFSFRQNEGSEASSITVFSTSSAANYQWEINGSNAGSTDSISLLVTQSDFSIKLMVESENGCRDSLTSILHFEPSASPLFSDLQVCFGDSYVLRPTNGNLFSFYQDAELTHFIKKGSELIIDKITHDTTFYVLGLDNVLPSEVVSAKLSVVDFNDPINAFPQQLFLTETKSASFSGVNPSSISRKWYVDGVFFGQLDSINVYLGEEKNYEIILQSKHPLGCISLDTLRYEVLTIRPLSIQETNSILLFPNPTQGKIHIKSPILLDQAVILDLSGKVVLPIIDTSLEQNIDLSALQNGIYFLRLSTSGKSNFYRIVLEK